MTKKCDNKSVGMLVWSEGNLLLIERKKQPFGFAPPAGHVDEDITFEESAKRELEEEVGLVAQDIQLIAEGRKDNLCRRTGGSWHYWKIYNVETEGEIKRSEDETKQAVFCSKSDILALAEKTKKYLQGEIGENEWERSPGLELVWYEWLQELKII